jgi:hypothetical protein
VISDGQSWAARWLRRCTEARARKIPVHVAGIGTTTGGMIRSRPPRLGPDPRPWSIGPDRSSLVQIAVAGGGRFGSATSPTASLPSLIDRLHRQSDVSQQVDSFDDLYRRFLMAAAVMLGLGMLFLHKRSDLVWQAGGVAVAVILLATLVAG